jgi:ATP-dependent exoDNAse (exonuclease V) beta subunit
MSGALYVERIVEAARTNRVSAEELARSCTRSLETAAELLGTPAADGAELDRRLCSALESLIAGAAGTGDATKTTAGAVERADRSIRALQAGESLSWSDWATLASSLKAAKASDYLCEPVREAAAAHDIHPALHADVRRAIELVFSIAARVCRAYEDRKRAWGVIDFVDQEALTLELLEKPDVRDQLSREIRCVFVDEFQDTSPLQLAIFLKLAEIAERSVWVGDRKQAIFGFRGTDPSLMSAAVAKLGQDDSDQGEPEPSMAGTDPVLVDAAVGSFAGRDVEVLDRNWRSRQSLVALTSDLFAAGFAPHGFAEREVRCTAEHAEPADLGATVEHWELDLENRSKSAQYPWALAVAVRELLDDPAVRVRDRATGNVRRAQPGDVAILCRRHLTARRVATALGEQGVRAALPRPGLGDTPEVRAAVAGLRLWIDPGERLARAEVARILRDAEYDGLLEDLVVAKTAGEALRLPELERVDAKRTELADAGPLEALDRVVDALGLRDRCRCWGSSEQRLANLDALRSLVARHAETCRAQRVACTVAGAVAYLEEAVANEEDGRAVVAADAVTVSTWHASKGLEWPITVLFDLEWCRMRHDWGVKVGFGDGEFDPAEPLRGRWIRFWPTPYRWNQRQPPFYQRLQEHLGTVRAMQEDKKEQLRLLYVGWTRARDRVVLAAPRGKLNDGILGELRGTNGPLIADPVERTAWNGREVAVAVRHAMPAEPRPLEQVADPGYPARPARYYAPRATRPSALVGADARVVDSGLY